MLGYPPTPPWGVRRLTARPAEPKVWVNRGWGGGGGGLLQPPTTLAGIEPATLVAAAGSITAALRQPNYSILHQHPADRHTMVQALVSLFWQHVSLFRQHRG